MARLDDLLSSVSSEEEPAVVTPSGDIQYHEDRFEITTSDEFEEKLRGYHDDMIILKGANEAIEYGEDIDSTLIQEMLTRADLDLNEVAPTMTSVASKGNIDVLRNVSSVYREKVGRSNLEVVFEKLCASISHLQQVMSEIDPELVGRIHQYNDILRTRIDNLITADSVVDVNSYNIFELNALYKETGLDNFITDELFDFVSNYLSMSGNTIREVLSYLCIIAEDYQEASASLGELNAIFEADPSDMSPGDVINILNLRHTVNKYGKVIRIMAALQEQDILGLIKSSFI